jgi:GNAT superfamily N-acetyltransferase
LARNPQIAKPVATEKCEQAPALAARRRFERSARNSIAEFLRRRSQARVGRGMVLSEILIRTIRTDERTQWESLWKGYQSFYQVAISDETTAVTWMRLHDPAEPMGALGAYLGGKLCGIAHYLFHRSCWTIGNYCYLQDLFVAEEARRRGLARALIAAVEAEARAAGASRLYWLTQEGNAGARALYDRLAERSGFIQYRKLFHGDSDPA